MGWVSACLVGLCAAQGAWALGVQQGVQGGGVQGCLGGGGCVSGGSRRGEVLTCALSTAERMLLEGGVS